MLFQSRPNAVSIAVARQQADVRSFVEMACQTMAATMTTVRPSSSSADQALQTACIRRLRLLHRIDRFMVRDCLSAAFSTINGPNSRNDHHDHNTAHATGAHPLVERLSYWAHQHDSLAAASWLRELLNDRRSMSHHDEFSRSLHTGCFFAWVLELVQQTSSSSATATTYDYHRPMLIIVADLCSIIIPPLYCSTEAVEALIEIVSTTTMRRPAKKTTQTGNSKAGDDDFDSDTPMAANLSRLDNNGNNVMMMMPWPEVVEERVDRGMDAILKLAVGLLLATVAPLCDNPIAQGRAVEEAMHVLQAVGDVSLSMDMAVRTLRLTNALWTTTTTAVNEGHVATITHSSGHRLLQQNWHKGSVIRQQQATIQDLRAQLDASEQKHNSLRLELRQSCQKHQLEKSEIQHQASREATRAIQAHVTERQTADRIAAEMQAKAADIQIQLVKAVESERSAKAGLDIVNASLRLALEQKDRLEQSANELGSRLQEMEVTIVDAKERVQHLSEKEAELLDRVQRQHEDLVEMQTNETALRNGLENLFEDMVFMAQMYEHQEKHAVTFTDAHREELKSLKGRVQKLQVQNQDLTERESRLQHEKELRGEMYSKLEEKLEQERRDHQREDEQRLQRSTTSAAGGTAASYMSHLHADQSSRRREKHTDSEVGKENTSSSLASSSRAGSGRSQLHR
jgi:hypothetical protein